MINRSTNFSFKGNYIFDVQCFTNAAGQNLLLYNNNNVIMWKLRHAMWQYHTNDCWEHIDGNMNISKQKYIEGILPKGPHLPCVSMAGRARLAGYPRYVVQQVHRS